MKQSILLLAIALFVSTTVTAQNDEVSILPASKKLNHHVGVQMNELVRQVFNFNNSNNSNVNNPYLLMYTVNLAKNGWGLRVGVGPNFNKFNENDGVTERENDINKINARLGIEKSFRLSTRWSAGAGIDGLYGNENNRTISTIRSFDTTTTDISSKIQTYGGGAMAWLRYHLTEHVVIGTETSFYYTLGTEEQEVTITTTGNTIITPGPSPFPITQSQTTTTTTDNDISNGVFSLPVVFYLIVSF